MKKTDWKEFGLGTLGAFLLMLGTIVFFEIITPAPILPGNLSFLDSVVILFCMLILSAVLGGGLALYATAYKEQLRVRKEE